MSESPGRVVILIVEDDPNVSELLSTVLTEEGYDILAAASGEEALTTIATIWPALITLDLDLPGITGDRILAELRRRDNARALPVVIVSAAHPIPAAVREMADAVVPKPFDLDELLTVIRRFVPPPEATGRAC